MSTLTLDILIDVFFLLPFVFYQSCFYRSIGIKEKSKRDVGKNGMTGERKREKLINFSDDFSIQTFCIFIEIIDYLEHEIFIINSK